MQRNFVLMLALAATAAAQAARPTIDVYVGGYNGTNATKVKMRYNIAMQQTVLSSRDFACTNATNCTTDGVSYNVSLAGTPIQYYRAYVSVNLLNAPFNDTLQVYYIYNDLANVGSVLGLSQDSTFLSYFFAQNQKAGLNVAFNLDSQGYLDFHPFAGANYTSLGPGPYKLAVSTYYEKDWKIQNARLCFANTIDDDATNSSIIGVANRSLSDWTSFLSRYYQKEADENYFYLILTDDRGTYVTQFNYMLKDLMYMANSRNGPQSYVRAVPDAYADFRGCDVFTGSLLLQKFDWHLVYVENANSFDYKYVVKAPRQLISPPPRESEGVSGWVILLVLILLGVAGYFVYQWYLNKQRAEATAGEGYMAMNIPPVEMNEVPRNQGSAP